MTESRDADKTDIPLLVRHHRAMFEEIRGLAQKPLDPGKLAAMDERQAEKLSRELSTPACAAFIAEEGGRPAGSLAVSILSMVAVPEDPQERVAYIHSLFVEKPFRGRGAARALMERAVEHCRALGLVRIQLAASPAGRHLYESMGFGAIPEMMGLRLRPF